MFPIKDNMAFALEKGATLLLAGGAAVQRHSQHLLAGIIADADLLAGVLRRHAACRITLFKAEVTADERV
jgi:hypothetical protein